MFKKKPELKGAWDCIRIVVDQQRSMVSFHADNGKGEKAIQSTDMKNFPKVETIFPFIEMVGNSECKVRVSLK